MLRLRPGVFGVRWYGVRACEGSGGRRRAVLAHHLDGADNGVVEALEKQTWGDGAGESKAAKAKSKAAGKGKAAKAKSEPAKAKGKAAAKPRAYVFVFQLGKQAKVGKSVSRRPSPHRVATTGPGQGVRHTGADNQVWYICLTVDKPKPEVTTVELFSDPNFTGGPTR